MKKDERVTNPSKMRVDTSILISFCKHCGDDYAGLTPYLISKAASVHGLKPPVPTLLTPQKQAGVRNILTEYLGRC